MSKHKPKYYCEKCKIPFSVIPERESMLVKCPFCEGHRDVVDYGDYGDYDNVVLGGGSFNWNKK